MLANLLIILFLRNNSIIPTRGKCFLLITTAYDSKVKIEFGKEGKNWEIKMCTDKKPCAPGKKIIFEINKYVQIPLRALSH